MRRSSVVQRDEAFHVWAAIRPVGVGAHRLSLLPRHEDQRWGATSGRDPRDQPTSGNGDHDRRSPRRPEEPTQGIAEAADPAEAFRDRASAAIAAAARVAA